MKLVCLAAGVTLLALAVAEPTNNHQGIKPGDNVRSRREDSRIFFPGQPIPKPVTQPISQPVPQPKPDDSGVLAVPEDLNLLDIENLSRLNSISNISEFVLMFDLPLPAEVFVSTRFGGSDTQELASMANCKPELKTVELVLPVETNTMFFPNCVRLEQCGGCCYGPLLTCRPSLTKVVKLKVLKTLLTSPETVRRRSTRRRRQNEVSYHTVEVNKHVECACRCKVQEEHCNPDIHTYYENECSCVCNNSEEKNNCEAQNLTKYWDNDSCSCYCRRPEECSSGEYFSQISCRCETLAYRIGK